MTKEQNKDKSKLTSNWVLGIGHYLEIRLIKLSTLLSA